MALPELFTSASPPGNLTVLATLAEEASAVTTSIKTSVAAPTGLRGGQFHALIGSTPNAKGEIEGGEYVLVTAASTTTWTIKRAQDGSTGVIHASGSSIYEDITAGAMYANTKSVLGYGADSTGVADSTTAFAEAKAAGPVYAPAGTYRIEGVVDFAGSALIGDGMGLTTFVCNKAEATMFTCRSKKPCTLRGFSIENENHAPTSGSFIEINQGTVSFDAEIFVENIKVKYCWTGIEVRNTGAAFMRGIVLEEVLKRGFWFHNTTIEVTLSEFISVANETKTLAGESEAVLLLIEGNAAGLIFENGECGLGQRTLQIREEKFEEKQKGNIGTGVTKQVIKGLTSTKNLTKTPETKVAGKGIPAGAHVTLIKSETEIEISAEATEVAEGVELTFTQPAVKPTDNLYSNIFFDSGFFGALAEATGNSRFVNCWFANGRTANDYGLDIVKSERLGFVSCEFFGCGLGGIKLDKASPQIRITSCHFGNNNAVGEPELKDILVEAGAVNFSIIGCSFAKGTGGNTNAVEVQAGASNNYVIFGNIFEGYTEFGGPVLNKGTGTKQLVMSEPEPIVRPTAPLRVENKIEPGAKGFPRAISFGVKPELEKALFKFDLTLATGVNLGTKTPLVTCGRKTAGGKWESFAVKFWREEATNKFEVELSANLEAKQEAIITFWAAS